MKVGNYEYDSSQESVIMVSEIGKKTISQATTELATAKEGPKTH